MPEEDNVEVAEVVGVVEEPKKVKRRKRVGRPKKKVEILEEQIESKVYETFREAWLAEENTAIRLLTTIEGMPRANLSTEQRKEAKSIVKSYDR